jgi:hypothetical protein
MPSFLRLLVLGFILALFCHAEEKSGHLFILSGQSNMTGKVKKGFADVVTKALGDKATIVHHCKPGRGIRFWVKDYSLPEGHPMAGLSNNKSNGEEFPKLVELVKKSADAAKFKTVSFIWMQGESDANRDLSVAYEESFKKLTTRLKKELGIEDLPFVIGRINDVGLYGDEKRKAAWTRMRKVQQKLGNEDPLGTWIDTDDFITEDHKHAKGNIHYLGEMPVKLGERFGEAALNQLEAK